MRIPPRKNKSQGGFTLIELGIVIVLIGLIASVFLTNFNTNKSKATILFAAMTEVGKSLMRIKLDTSCYPNKLVALYDKTQATQSFCGVDLTPSWNGPYTQRTTFDTSSGNILMNNVAPGAQLTITEEPSSVGEAWIVRATGVPNEIIKEAMTVCNGPSAGTSGSGTSTVKCASSAGTGTGTFDLVFDENS